METQSSATSWSAKSAQVSKFAYGQQKSVYFFYFYFFYQKSTKVIFFLPKVSNLWLRLQPVFAPVRTAKRTVQLARAPRSRLDDTSTLPVSLTDLWRQHGGPGQTPSRKIWEVKQDLLSVFI